MAEITDHLDDTYFAWTGPTTDDAAYYMRIQSRVIYIEFNSESGGPASGAVEAATDAANATKTGVTTSGQGGGGGDASRNHIHSVVRTPNGNDYGFDLLKDHLATHPH